MLLLVPHVAGCYHYAPVSSAGLPPGTQVSVGITDRGRVALADAIGPGALRVEGQLLANTDTALVLGVTSVRHLDLPIPVNWAGERVSVSRDFISDTRQRTLSRSRTVLMAGLAVLGVVAATFIAIRGFGVDDDQPPRPPNGQNGEQH